jgi:hypothetical protein
VRRVRGETLLLLHRAVQLIEGAVERDRQLFQFIFRALHRDARRKIPRRHGGRGAADVRNRRQRAADQEPPSDERDRQRDGSGEGRDARERQHLTTGVGQIPRDHHARAVGTGRGEFTPSNARRET